MRLRLLVVAVMMAGAGAVWAQDPGTDAAMQAAQQSMQMAQRASQQATDAMNQATQNAQTQMQMAQQAAMNNNVYGPARPRPPLPMTPAPSITPGGGRFRGSVQVAIADDDPRAVVFYTTDGTRPTTSSSRYVGPIVVTGKTKVQALAFDLNEMPSAVVKKKFKVTG